MENKKTLENLLRSAHAIIFDFDGVIADSEYYHFLAYNKVFERYGHTLNPDEYWLYFTSIGEGPEGEISRYKLVGIDPEKVKSEKAKIYMNDCVAGKIKIFPTADELMKVLKEKGYKTAIASNSSIDVITTILEVNNFKNYPDIIIGGKREYKLKPEPDIFIASANKLEVIVGKCLVIEDAEKGIIAAHNAGMKCVIVRTKENKNFDFPSADCIVNNLEEILETLKNL